MYKDRQGRASRAHAARRAHRTLPLPGTVLFICPSHPAPQPAPAAAAEGIEGRCCQRSIHLATAESRPRLWQVPTVTLFSLNSQGATRTTDWSIPNTELPAALSPFCHADLPSASLSLRVPSVVVNACESFRKGTEQTAQSKQTSLPPSLTCH